MESFINILEHRASDFIQANQGMPFPVLIVLAFGGGISASLTPCVLPMLPLYLSYIGASEVKSRFDAIIKALLFCSGSALIFSIMSLFASFANFIMIEFHGYVNIAVGLFILFMSLLILEIVKIPMPGFVKNIPHGGPFIVGIAFSLVSSPCASPILFAVLAMSSTAGSFVEGALIMVSYSIGYTALIFLSALFAGMLKQFEFFKRHNKLVSVVSSIILILIGGYYLYSGIKWFIG